MTQSSCSFDDIKCASRRIAGRVERTPLITSGSLDGKTEAKLFFKCENFQSAGVFKSRGAVNAVFSLSEEEARAGVLTHSSGNHAAALARAARLRSVQAYLVMPSNAPVAKRTAVERYGGKIIECGPTLEARESTAARVQAETGSVLIHPYDDDRVIAGQGTVGLELLQDAPDLDVIFCPVGGGGQLSGVALAAKAMAPRVRIIGVEPEGADDAYRSFKTGRLIPQEAPDTIADGLRTSLSERTFRIIQTHVSDIVCVSDAEIVAAMRLLWEVLKVVVEPSGAVAFAGALRIRADFRSRNVGVLISGGNLDLDKLPWQT